MGYGRAFNAVETIVINGKIEISSTYRYRVIVSRQFEWPFSDIMKDIFDEKYEGVSHCLSSPLFLIQDHNNADLADVP